MMNLSSVRCLVALLVIALSVGACGSDDITAPGEPGIHVLTEPISDTIEAIIPAAFRIEVRDSDGQPMRGAVVHFLSPSTFSPDLMRYVREVAVGRDVGPGPEFRDHVVDTTDAQGRASVRVRLGLRAVTGRLFIGVGDLLAPVLQDTVTFVIRPGAPVAVRMLPQDTTVYVDATLQLRGGVVDRLGNRIDLPVTYEAGPTLSVTNGGLVTPTIYARSHVIVRGAYGEDRGLVSVVPRGKALGAMHYEGGGAFVTFELDGSRVDTVPTLRGHFQAAPATSPDGRHFVYMKDPSATNSTYTLFVADSTGQETPLLPGATFRLASHARYSRDGAWIYFSAQVADFSWSIWRVHPDGSSLEQVVSNFAGDQTRPDPSPDGARLAIVTRHPPVGGWGARAVDLAQGVTSSWIVSGQTARWSPTGERIAVMPDGQGPIMVVDADGTDARAVSDDDAGFGQQAYSETFDWSPDGRWLIMNHDSMIKLLEVDTGLLLPLAWSRVIGQPSWWR